MLPAIIEKQQSSASLLFSLLYQSYLADPFYFSISLSDSAQILDPLIRLGPLQGLPCAPKCLLQDQNMVRLHTVPVSFLRSSWLTL